MVGLASNLKTFVKGKCPRCGGKAKSFLYGLVVGDPGEDTVLGGCCISGIEPDFVCVACDLEFGFGGRNYEVFFDLETEYTDSSDGRVLRIERSVNLMELTESEVIELAPFLIEARHELLHRSFSEDELGLMALQGNWKSFPLRAMYDLWVYWNRKTKKIEFGAQFFSEGVKHLHGIYRPERNNPSRTRKIEDFYREFSSTENLDLIPWNIRSPLPKHNTRSILDQDLIALMRSGAMVGEMLLQRFANPVPDRQMWPAWFDPEQEFGCV